MLNSPNSKTLTYRARYLPGYNNQDERCDEDVQHMSSKQLTKVKNWNTYQKSTWYQTHLNQLDRDECPVGVQAEFRMPGVAETKVSLMESGKWKTFQSTKNSSWEETFRSSIKDDDDFYAPETGLHNATFRPHTATATTIRQTTLNQTLESEIRKTKSQDDKTPPINPKTMFLPKSQKPIFGTLKDTQKLTSASSPTRPATSHSIRSNGYCNTTTQSNTQQDHLFATTLSTEESQALPLRPMSSQALSRRHMGVPLESSSEGNKVHGETYNSKIMTLKTSNQLNYRAIDDRTDGFTMSSYLDRTASHPHPPSGYHRGLKGTLLIDDWRNDELMKGDGKICFRPLSYDVLETLTYGPPDPTKKLSHDQNFVSLLNNNLFLIFL